MEVEENNNTVDEVTQTTKTKKKRKSGKCQNREENKRRCKTKQKETFWKFLEHNGPLLPPPYRPLPDKVPFFYNGTRVKLSPKTEEVATFYAKLLYKYTEENIFHENFFNDWRDLMTDEEKTLIQELSKCNFRRIYHYFNATRKILNRSEVLKKKLKEEEDKLKKQYGFCIVDGEEQEVANFKIEPPGLFRGRGPHPKAGKVKKRIQPEDITINCSEDSKIPAAPDGHKWKEVVHDNTVTWLAKWTDSVLEEDRYVRLSSCSKLKTEEDKKKFATAKLLDDRIETIRQKYFEDMDSEDLETKQRAVALYLIDELGLRTGNDKDEDKADTVGCCSLRVEHVKLYEEKDGEDFVVVFDFLGKDAIQYYNEVSVHEKVFKNLQLFEDGKTPDDHLFDCLTTIKLNDYLNKQMDGLTAKVFRTYNASFIFETFLEIFTDPKSYKADKIQSYRCANLAAALLLNHRKIPEKPLLGKEERITEIKKELQTTLQKIKEEESDEEWDVSQLFQSLKGLLFKNREIALDTSKSNYLDPRISVAWCRKYDIRLEKIFTKKADWKKFGWALSMEDADYSFSQRNVEEEV